MTHDELIAVIAAHRDGKLIEAKAKNDPDAQWQAFTTSLACGWDTWSWEYRIKPEPPKPRELFVYFWNEVEPTTVWLVGDPRLDAVRARDDIGSGLVRFREVLPDEEGKA